MANPSEKRTSRTGVRTERGSKAPPPDDQERPDKTEQASGCGDADPPPSPFDLARSLGVFDMIGPPSPFVVDPVKFSAVWGDELTEIAAHRPPRPFSDKEKTKQNLTGLCLSGGGIRSACFNLGFLEGLDRMPYPPTPRPNNGFERKLHPSIKSGGPKAKAGGAVDHNHLEFFDYVSSVSGGSCAAGHLATAMLPSDGDPQRLGDVPLTSKTVPGWLWGLGVWFLGTVFQLLKTGALLVGVLAVVALCMRVLDAPSASAFCAALGSDSDVMRGFAPLWITLWVFLVGYGFYVWWKDDWARYWFGYALLLAGVYVLVVSLYHDDHMNRPALWFLFHYGMLMALVLPVVLMCLVIMIRRVGMLVVRWCARRFAVWIAWCSVRLGGRPRRFIRRLARRSRGFSRWLALSAGEAATKRRHDDDDPESRFRLRGVLLTPLLVGMFCFAALVTTGDIEFNSTSNDPTQIMTAQDKSRWYGQLGDWIYSAAWGALGLTSLGLFFPRSLLQSARQIEEQGAADRKPGGFWFKSRGWEPIFRVVVFLCSYGIVLLVLFLVFSTVAKENVSGYYDWRKDLPSEAFHFTDFRDSELAWGQIAHDAMLPSASSQSELPPSHPWTPLATKLIEARNAAMVPLNEERGDLAELRLLDSLPWINRVLGPLASYLPMPAWKKNNYDLDPSPERHYELIAKKTKNQRAIASEVAKVVLNDLELYKLFPKESVAPESYLQKKLKVKWDPARYEGLERRYRERACVLEAAALEDPKVKDSAAFQSAVRNNNRYALNLYLPVIMRDRRDHVVFSSIVWIEDQWTRLRIALAALVVWGLCCAVDVNTFSLHAFYRAHVISNWVKVPPGKKPKRFLYETERTYRGHESGRNGPPNPRRAPLLLFNATLEGNRWLGQEPELPLNIFEFSPIAVGSGETKFWRRREVEEENPKSPGEQIWRQEFARRNRLDIGQIVAISGAFLAPGTVANPALSAVLHLLNIQTGSWVRHPREFEERSTWESLKFHACQSLGVDDEGDSRYMLTDGAHVENLGLYSLLRRRCTLIVASDCSQEDRSEQNAARRFDALVQVLQQASVDGVEIGPFLSSRAFLHKGGEVSKVDEAHCRHKRSTGLSLVLPVRSMAGGEKGSGEKAGKNVVTVNVLRGDSEKPKQPDAAENPPAPSDPKLSPAGRDEVSAGLNLSQEHFVFARITYPEGGSGLLVYLRPTLTGDEGDALLHGAAAASFPDDDPMDQFYSPSKMNTYRLLGRHIAVELMHDPVMRRVLRRIVDGRPIGSTNLDDEPTCQEYCGASAPPCLRRIPRPFRAGEVESGRRSIVTASPLDNPLNPPHWPFDES